MTDHTPALQHSETDGFGPKRRRRPALSCVECRLRKVKCDREKPCGACTRTKSPTCTYRPPQHAAARRARSPAGTSSTGQEGTSSARSSPQPHHPSASAQVLNFDAMINRYIAPGIFGDHGKDRLGLLPSTLSSLSLGTNANENNTIRRLEDKVRDLEGRLAAISEGEPSSTALPIQDAGSPGQRHFVKSKFYGESHWNNCLEPYDALGSSNITVNENTNRIEVNKASELYITVAECKRMARTIKSARMLQPSISPEIQASIPPKAVCDELVQCYLRTFEGVFRVLHIPTFLREYEDYWTSTNPPKPSRLLKMLLVCAIGVPFYTGPEQSRLRTSCMKWIQAAGSWLSAPHEKSRLNMAGLQIHILLLLARQVCSVDGDLIWIPGGALLRSAMHLGLHRDPARYTRISIFHAEMRRRLWATVLELTVQSSLDMGMPPMVSPQDYDTLPPANINDEDIGEDISTPLKPKPLSEFTQTSIQIAFSQTLPRRLEITRLINNLRFDLSYDEVLHLGTDLITACRQKITFFQSCLSSSPGTNPFQIKLFDTLVRRFVLCLHRPFFAKAKDNPRYHYSRKICLDTSLIIAGPAKELADGEEDDWTRLARRAVGFWKSFFLYAISTVYLELISQIEEQRQDVSRFGPLTSTSVNSDSTPSTTQQPLPLPPQFSTLRAVLVSAYNTAQARIHNGETNSKGVVFLACALARVDALVSNSDADLAVLNAARSSIIETSEMMRDAYVAEHGTDIDMSFPLGPFAGRDHGRGEGADDVTGVETNAQASIPRLEIHDGAFEDSVNFAQVDPIMGDAMSSGLDVGGLGGFENMDFMYDENMEFGFGFEGSPENYFLGGWEGVGGMSGGFGMPG